MAFLKKALKWMSPGVEPSEEKKQQGFQNGEFPSAGHFDFMFKSTADAIEELQAKAGEVKTVNGQSPNANGNIDVSIDTNLLATKEELATHKLEYAQFKTAIEKEVAELQNANELSVVKSGKDSEGIFTTVTYKRKSDNTIFAKSVLSGGTSPQYTTRTLTFYNADGFTVKVTKIYTLSYDADGDLVSEV